MKLTVIDMENIVVGSITVAFPPLIGGIIHIGADRWIVEYVDEDSQVCWVVLKP